MKQIASTRRAPASARATRVDADPFPALAQRCRPRAAPTLAAPTPAAPTPAVLSRRLGALHTELLSYVKLSWAQHSVGAGRAELVDTLSALQRLEGALAAMTGQVALALVESDGMEQSGQRQVALATKRSPHSAGLLVSNARVLRDELPHTLVALMAGNLTPGHARAIIRETGCLEPARRSKADALLCADPQTLAGNGIRRTADTAREITMRLDQQAALKRHQAAAAGRYVSLRPLPDGMCRLSAGLPLTVGVSAFAVLHRYAQEHKGVGDEGRGRGELMADHLAECVLGRQGIEHQPLHISLVMSDITLLGGGDDPATLLDAGGAGYGPVPAPIARNLATGAIEAGELWLRRLYTSPAGDLIAATSLNRFFTNGLACWARTRDHGICRTPYCNAPARHLDHILPHSRGGRTSIENAQGLCVWCNENKEKAGWTHQTTDPDVAGGRHTVVTTTPTGHAYRSTAPPPPGCPGRSVPLPARGPTRHG
ncbi:MAG: DUF222 domain-containing protein [Promicromonosporaceae bacterium]|nr:DUF222 domain-containing protein [Promicromonosporaceae bacterium]